MITLFGHENEKKEPSLLERLKQSVSKTRTELAARVEQLLTGDRPVDPELLRQLENALLSADIGVRTTKEIIVALRQQVNEHKLADASDLRRELKNQVLKILVAPAANIDKLIGAATNNVPTRVLFVVGVNGTGKTTTIGKLAQPPAPERRHRGPLRRRYISRRRHRATRSVGQAHRRGNRSSRNPAPIPRR